ncbi:MAG: hypothetical protein JWO99_671 [Candidatus Saccharibacteria bacterium]|nr:hypothetical protein [Candidatus Saccharibacteria bacterium]
MKRITCKQLGGPCDTVFHANTADEAIKLQDKHLKDMVAAGDTVHADALKEMKERWRHPFKAMGWYNQTKKDFAALPKE